MIMKKRRYKGVGEGKGARKVGERTRAGGELGREEEGKQVIDKARKRDEEGKRSIRTRW